MNSHPGGSLGETAENSPTLGAHRDGGNAAALDSSAMEHVAAGTQGGSFRHSPTVHDRPVTGPSWIVWVVIVLGMIIMTASTVFLLMDGGWFSSQRLSSRVRLGRAGLCVRTELVD